MTDDTITGWLHGRLPDDWFTAAPDVTIDRDEILVVGRLAAPDNASAADNASAPENSSAEAGRIASEAKQASARDRIWQDRSHAPPLR